MKFDSIDLQDFQPGSRKDLPVVKPLWWKGLYSEAVLSILSWEQRSERKRRRHQSGNRTGGNKEVPPVLDLAAPRREEREDREKEEPEKTTTMKPQNNTKGSSSQWGKAQRQYWEMICNRKSRPKKFPGDIKRSKQKGEGCSSI